MKLTKRTLLHFGCFFCFRLIFPFFDDIIILLMLENVIFYKVIHNTFIAFPVLWGVLKNQAAVKIVLITKR